MHEGLKDAAEGFFKKNQIKKLKSILKLFI
jgi:hypothetical protein